ncbi:MAG: hypothetical protein ABGW74_03735 [Campylobacterales bacterium]
MAYIIGLVVLGLLFLALHYFTELDKKQKIAILSMLFVVIASAISYNKYTLAKQDKMLNVVMRFNQHKTVECNGIKVDDKNFSLSIGTYTFIGKKDTPHYEQMIGAVECR